MTLLQIMPDEAPQEVTLRTDDAEVIQGELSNIGVRYERWAADHPLPADLADSEITDAYSSHIDRICAEEGYRLVDVARMTPAPEDPNWPALARKAREKFLEEHFHTEDEVRFFVEGTGCFYLHVNGKVYAMVCTSGDLLSVPSRTVHWFDMGSEPHFTAIRFFQEEDGWVGQFLPHSIASRFPTLDELRSA
ncbi:1,2-dihydroxy-3-keto-5-methylthiopentene dioxygenase [Streptomyces meridianus]|uniref:Acireductone dioxygenase n=1 Tax=Streptomyces meridianus TaxID=2938945 RepID=A0ABT0XD03_9ACTN|nr:cupin [Streptomyces meridianus]MCM2579602.1 cupin [Streptomyces meridianus]